AALQLEITESRFVAYLRRARAALDELRAVGVMIAIDDFGTGYSSLSYLKRLPVDVLKIDKSFLDTLDSVDADVAIVAAVITMGHALGMKVTAEGVERVEQADLLRDLGCDSAMGWLWSAALTPAELAKCALVGFPMAGGDTGAVVLPMRARA
ncbi:MAG TPA: EAL domain-containing protein, partial [Acidimicrobiia bacterium]|nr:EAL domain-containing protein [Acidimicrobiia bacterium]